MKNKKPRVHAQLVTCLPKQCTPVLECLLNTKSVEIYTKLTTLSRTSYDNYVPACLPSTLRMMYMESKDLYLVLNEGMTASEKKKFWDNFMANLDQTSVTDIFLSTPISSPRLLREYIA